MKILGIALLVLGFLWITWDAIDGFNVYQHSRWIWQSQHLPEGETIKRDEAVRAMRELSLALKDQHRVVLLPALLMLAGGLIAAFGRKRQQNERTASSMSGLVSTILLVAAFLCGCQHQSALERVTGLDGLTEAQIIAQLGAPLRRVEFPMSKAIDEFHGPLQNYHPLPQSKDVVIHELTWEQPKAFVTAWLHETNGTWRVFDNLRYRKDVVF